MDQLLEGGQRLQVVAEDHKYQLFQHSFELLFDALLSVALLSMQRMVSTFSGKFCVRSRVVTEGHPFSFLLWTVFDLMLFCAMVQPTRVCPNC